MVHIIIIKFMVSYMHETAPNTELVVGSPRSQWYYIPTMTYSPNLVIFLHKMKILMP